MKFNFKQKKYDFYGKNLQNQIFSFKINADK